jgi:16S rRNA (cytosine1402-N4)-methyltransferase
MAESKNGHIPVLLEEVLAGAEPLASKDGIFIDGTFGRGGHTRALLEKFPKMNILGLDCDADAVEFAQKNMATYGPRFNFTRANFSDFAGTLKGRPLIGVLLDLGVSSPQLDQGPRGFSFYNDGPLDMRMDQRQDVTAADIVNNWDEESLIELFRELGEVRNPTKVVSWIVTDRKKTPFTTTGQLAGLIERADRWQKKGHHPATTYFQALRIQVNDELGRLRRVLPQMVSALTNGGRILVITFHSLEDRIVKEAFRQFEDENAGIRVNKKVLQAEWDEKKNNPRARSAKLRIFERQQQ